MELNKAVDCLRCRARMEGGYVADATYGGQLQQNWSPGEPRQSFWTGLKTDKGHIVPIFTYRCPQCGYLESYALPQITSELK